MAKVAVIGAGSVGATFTYSLMINGLVEEILLIDANRAKAEAEAMDLNHGLGFVKPVKIRTGEYAECSDVDVAVITAGAKQRPNESRLDLVTRNVEIFNQIVTAILKSGFTGIFLIVANPVDVLTYLTYKISGFPVNKIIGSGTVLDSYRLRYLLSKQCAIDPRNVHVYVIGEHGDSSIAAWSLATIAGVRIHEYCTLCGKGCNTIENRTDLFLQVRQSAYQIISAKGATYYAIGLSLLRIMEAIIRNENQVLPVSTVINGVYGISDVALSLPSVINSTGIVKVVPIELSQDEIMGLQKSARVLKEIIQTLHI